ncbi:nicotinamide N-methyltransferase-like [Mixophyes fleayi]|uniref:nicotinamide N-methyltransferase-like n=1 Tax=Mixophyes fleayi TaxID=3061075 RepID=UPI003F4E09B5
MDCSSHRCYHEDKFDSRDFLDTYFSSKTEKDFADESVKFPMEALHRFFNAVQIKGEILIDITTGPVVHHLYSACEFFKKIYLLRFNEECIIELNRWLNTRTGAFEWNHATEYAANLEGNSDQCEDKDMRLKTAITKIVKCDMEKKNLTDSVVLPQADCVISATILEASSKDQDDYIRSLRKIIALLKPCGCLILVGILNATYYVNGKDRFNLFKYDENFLRNVLAGEGFIIDHCDVLRRKAVSDLTDYDSIIVIAAHREK